MLIVDKHCSDISDIYCDEFSVLQIDRKSKQVKNSDMKKFIWNQYGENRYFKHKNYQNLWMNKKVRSD